MWLRQNQLCNGLFEAFRPAPFQHENILQFVGVQRLSVVHRTGILPVFTWHPVSHG